MNCPSHMHLGVNAPERHTILIADSVGICLTHSQLNHPSLPFEPELFKR